MLRDHIINFVIIQNQTLSFDCHSTRNLLWCRAFWRDDKALNGCINCESITEFTWDQIYQVLLGCCWTQAHVLWWQLPVQSEMRWSSKSTNPCISCVRLDAIWQVMIKCQKDIWLRDYFSNILLYPSTKSFTNPSVGQWSLCSIPLPWNSNASGSMLHEETSALSLFLRTDLSFGYLALPDS